MDAKWHTLISQRTSNEIVRAEVSDFFAGIPEYDDSSDFQAIKSGLVKSITDLRVGTSRRADDEADVFPFPKVASVLDLMPVAAKHRREFPHLYRYSLVPDDLRLENEFEDGCRMYQLATPEAVIVMIAEDADRRQRGSNPEKRELWLVVSGEGHHLALFETSQNTFNGIVLIKQTDQTVQSHVLQFIRAKELSLLHPCALTGLVEGDDGAMHPIWRMPDGITVNGNLKISRIFRNLVKLPDNMTVKGNLHIDSAQSLVTLPENLTVHGDLRVTDCDNLIEIGKGATVRGETTLYGNNSLRTVGPGCSFEGDLKLDNTRLLSQDFSLGGSAWIGVSKDARRVAYPPSLLGRILGGFR